MERGQQKFEHSVLEQDINRLSQEVRERREGRAAEHPQEAVREVLREKIYPAPTAPAPQTPTDQGIVSILPVYLQKESPEVKLKIEELIDLTLHQGIDKAIAEAKQYGPFVLDALHDALTVKLYNELKNRKLV
jgi:hypothetical protein